MSKTDKTVSQKMSDLGELVAWFESDEFELEQAIAKYKEAEKVAGEIERDLAELKNEITVLKQKFE
ncbi:MAG: exodeoxyribonuclease VII small subunit [Candidatus Saccharimonas sp.]